MVCQPEIRAPRRQGQPDPPRRASTTEDVKELYVIALCDDEERALDQIEGLLACYQKRMQQDITFQTERFTSAEELLKRVRKEKYRPDLMLLDIFMSGKNGIEAAEELRRLGLNMPLVFLTTSTEHALKAYGVDAIQYLVKPFDQEHFFHAIDSALGQIHRIKESQITIKVAGGFRQINLQEIIYCESQKNYQVFYLAMEECRARMTASGLWEILERFYQFGRCGRSYILNMDHIVSVERGEIVMDNGATIYVPRNKAAEFKKSYFSYYFDRRDDTGGGKSTECINHIKQPPGPRRQAYESICRQISGKF